VTNPNLDLPFLAPLFDGLIPTCAIAQAYVNSFKLTDDFCLLAALTSCFRNRFNFFHDNKADNTCRLSKIRRLDNLKLSLLGCFFGMPPFTGLQQCSYLLLVSFLMPIANLRDGFMAMPQLICFPYDFRERPTLLKSASFFCFVFSSFLIAQVPSNQNQGTT
jgi:hypothetical protein